MWVIHLTKRFKSPPMRNRIKFIFVAFLLIIGHLNVHSQKIEAAYSEWDDQFDEWKIHVNEEIYVIAIKQYGNNTFSRWNLTYENEDEFTRGYMQLKWAEDFNYFDFFLGQEQLSITTIYRNDPTVWKISHGDQTLVIQQKNQFEWSKRSRRDFEWVMYEVNNGFIHDWYIDDSSTDEISFEMRVAATLIIIEKMAFIR